MKAPDLFKSKRIPRFVEEYVKDRNGTQAAIRAGYSVASAHSTASALLSDPKVQGLVAEEMERVTKEARVEAADVLREWMAIATADPSKLMRVRRVNCRYCWGIGHAYQWSAREYAEACDAAAKCKPPAAPPDCGGGFDWRAKADPNPECPECCGDGEEDIHFVDTETLTGPEKKLFAGVKRTRDGLEIKLRDQDAALLNIARHIGMLIERKELTGANQSPLMPTSIIVCGPDE